MGDSPQAGQLLQTGQEDGELFCDQDRKLTPVRGKIRSMAASPLFASHGLGPP